MKSIQTKFLIVVLTCLIMSNVVIGTAGVVSSKRMISKNSVQTMNLYRDREIARVNGILERVEQSVDTLADYAVKRIGSAEQFREDAVHREASSALIENVAIQAGDNTSDAVGVYVRYAPEIAGQNAGVFYSKTASNDNFEKMPLTDFSLYEPDDIGHVGWYYIPKAAGRPTWVEPYFNENNNIWMVSYVIPIMVDGIFMGVAGMDVDFAEIEKSVSQIHIYETGHAFLADEQGVIIFHPDLEAGTNMRNLDNGGMKEMIDSLTEEQSTTLFSYEYDSKDKMMTFGTLRNGMKLVLDALVEEIQSEYGLLLSKILKASFLIMAAAIVLTVMLTRRIVKPLKELNVAAGKIAEGDLSITVEHHSKDEVGTLADSFRKTVEHLKKYIDYINGLAYRDGLTGVRNRTAYLEAVKQMDEQIRLRHPEFAVGVFDLNDLKAVNDTLGHDMGDLMIVDASMMICKVFRKSAVYRIGGDEFTVILENGDYENHPALFAKLQEQINCYNSHAISEFNIEIAMGVSAFHYDSDLCFNDVFKRADDAMYQNKIDKKERKTQEENE